MQQTIGRSGDLWGKAKVKLCETLDCDISGCKDQMPSWPNRTCRTRLTQSEWNDSELRRNGRLPKPVWKMFRSGLYKLNKEGSQSKRDGHQGGGEQAKPRFVSSRAGRDRNATKLPETRNGNHDDDASLLMRLRRQRHIGARDVI